MGAVINQLVWSTQGGEDRLDVRVNEKDKRKTSLETKNISTRVADIKRKEHS